MASGQKQTQEQGNVQLQRLTPLQLLHAGLVELPVAGLEERVKRELYENDALEEGRDVADNSSDDVLFGDDSAGDGDFDAGGDDVLSVDGIDSDYAAGDDELPVYVSNSSGRGSSDFVIGDTDSLIDDLMQQVSEYDLTDHKKAILTYLIGSLNDNGFMDRDLYSVEAELGYKMGVDTDEEEILEVLKILQEFDPPGIGARNLRECLLIQINRQIRSTHSDDIVKLELLRLERQIVDECHDLLVNNNADKIAQRTGVSVMRANVAMEGIKRLNPRPGMALSESASDRSQTVVPDFIIETDGEGGISFTLNDGYVPALRVDKCFEREFLEGQERYAGMNQRERDAFAYRKQKVESARMFIDAIAMRRRTLYVTMKAIVELQREFFLTQDDTKIKPMILRDVAEKTNLDESTVSRVKSSKYALVDGHVYPLDHFFLRARVNSKGDLVFGHKVMQMIREIIDSEDKLAPYSDEKLVELLLEKGQDIKHRTVTKYRNQMGIPPARLRKKL